jgi:hypothetical protein
MIPFVLKYSMAIKQILQVCLTVFVRVTMVKGQNEAITDPYYCYNHCGCDHVDTNLMDTIINTTATTINIAYH